MSGKLQHTGEEDLRVIDDEVEWVESRKNATRKIQETQSGEEVAPDFYNFKQCLSAEKCADLMKRFYHKGKHEKGRIANGLRMSDVREVDLYYYEDREVIDFLKSAFDDVNRERFFNFDIEAIESPHMCVYHGSDAGHYGWHIDWKNNSEFRRVISMSMLLNSGSEFEGGDLELFVALEPDGNPVCAKPVLSDAGDVCFFKSNITHRVKPVTLGTRVALVAWAWGNWGNKQFSE